MTQAHPSLDIQGSLGKDLIGKKIALCMTGSVAVIRGIDIARLLMRHGADVFPIMTEAAAMLIHPNLVQWSTGNVPVTELSGAIEHVALAGNVEGKVDLVIVAPATANTIGKIAAGIDDTPVTTVVTTAFGEKIPILIVPAMHEPMYKHPIVKQNIIKLEELGVTFLMPKVEEGKAKIADPVLVCDAAREILTSSPKVKLPKRVLITVGRTVEYIDPVRVITNNSTGKMGMALAEEALKAGAQVTVVYGKGTVAVPRGATCIDVDTAEQMRDAVFGKIKQSDVLIAAAAVGDWQPDQMAQKKITTHGTKKLTLELVPTPKIIDGIRDLNPEVYLVAFRAQHDLTTEELLDDAFARLQKARANLIAVNDVSKKGAGFGTDTNEMYLIDQERKVTHIPLMSKKSVAFEIIKAISEELRR